MDDTLRLPALASDANPWCGDGVELYAVQLQQVMVNLISNGIAAMEDGQRQRILRIGRTNGEDREVAVAVEDCGQGIEPQVAERVFDPLFTTKREGLGMGLAICRSIIEAHGGRIWISAGVPHGSIFRFSVPSRARV